MTEDKQDANAEEEEEFIPSRGDKIVAFTLASPIMALTSFILLLVIIPLMIVRSAMNGEFKFAGKLLVMRLLPTVIVLVAIYYALQAAGWVA